ncbi:uncharacterized protein LOC130015249 [Mercurialis annua]|uniref:uncharacterized protein LOC130015249 n=1 Tax=Mercurialis annua TaxID=3986 RepID=UPI0024AD006E|nr:uncharacterized protein LOC130015249 [Mercurialis annua]
MQQETTYVSLPLLTEQVSAVSGPTGGNSQLPYFKRRGTVNDEDRQLERNSEEQATTVDLAQLTMRNLRRPVKKIDYKDSLQTASGTQFETENEMSDGDFQKMNRIYNKENRFSVLNAQDEATKTWDIGNAIGILPTKDKDLTGGLLNSRKQKFIRDMVSANKLAFMGLVESKKELVDDFLLRKLWPNLDFDFAFVPSCGASGGLLLIWNTALMKNVVVGKGNQRSIFWRELGTLLSFGGTIIVSGDFNEILKPEERVNCVDFSPSMLELADFVNNLELLDLHLQGRYFTWQNSISKSRIDRCMISADMGMSWPDMTLTALPRGLSDHVPICFKSAKIFDWGPKPFRSVDAWWDHDDFENFILAAWSNCSSLNVVHNLKDLRRQLKNWNRDVFGDQNKRISEISADIHEKKMSADAGLLSAAKVDDLANLKSELWKAEKRIESLWRQKSRLKWNLVGDRNTKFFHSIAFMHYKNNTISSVQVGEVVYSEPKDIRFHICSFYNSLYCKLSSITFTLAGLGSMRLSTAQGVLLTRPFKEEEIVRALCSCNEKKASGPDGFNFYFYRRAWPFLKPAILGLFTSFFNDVTLPQGINSSFMVLIPKVPGSSNIKDYRPISLVNGLYKLLSKVLSLRLAPQLSNIISENQHAFLKGRSILECSMISNELVHNAVRRKDKVLVLKLDFQKAFDSIDWGYLLSVKNCMGFP